MPPPSITHHTETQQDHINLPFVDLKKSVNRSESTDELKKHFDSEVGVEKRMTSTHTKVGSSFTYVATILQDFTTVTSTFSESVCLRRLHFKHGLLQ